MSTRTIQADARIENDPESVIAYISDVRNRPLYLSLLRSVDDVHEKEGVVGSTWRWTVGVLGMDFSGTGVCTGYEAGKRYSFTTEGGISSTWTYRANPEDGGTRLTVEVEYQVPANALAAMPTDIVLESTRKAEADRAVKNLKTILDR